MALALIFQDYPTTSFVFTAEIMSPLAKLLANKFKPVFWSSEVSMDLSEEESTPLVIRDRGGSQRSSSSTGSSLQVHLYLFPATKEATTIHISSGQISAENICIQAAKKCGEISLTICKL